ncbi:hypothetical protein G3N55_11740 [Dissulfurirhabdus thermomarina]|uniref:PH domain-containing protein n=1 Tax=Dissulfurirhabdus thermomarina TaxID=1765737 RepID=A0A6N9TYG0_DISTH|nr:hypothetical protein [Dissulfurirhabdus thermomarina]NDY43506.1 hypothetical protein [Dissulfurirhabdus thermomarina]NMX24551.1 hypothetical protein [Dissulfurirhabdus thermomarina]
MSVAESKTHLRAATSSYIIFIAIWGVPLAIWTVAFFVNGRVDWRGITICLAGLFGCILWLASFELTLTHDTVVYRSLFGGKASLPVEEISKVNIMIGCFSFADRFNPTSRLVIEPNQSSGRKPIVINIKPFSQKAVKDFLSSLDGARNRA